MRVPASFALAYHRKSRIVEQPDNGAEAGATQSGDGVTQDPFCASATPSASSSIVLLASEAHCSAQEEETNGVDDSSLTSGGGTSSFAHSSRRLARFCLAPKAISRAPGAGAIASRALREPARSHSRRAASARQHASSARATPRAELQGAGSGASMGLCAVRTNGAGSRSD